VLAIDCLKEGMKPKYFEPFKVELFAAANMFGH
jgi:hypothetical protein